MVVLSCQAIATFEAGLKIAPEDPGCKDGLRQVHVRIQRVRPLLLAALWRCGGVLLLLCCCVLKLSSRWLYGCMVAFMWWLMWWLVSCCLTGRRIWRGGQGARRPRHG